jgi:iron complex transport system substrate-binding protein
MAENNVNLETVVSLKPDIIFASPFERQIVDAIQRKTRIPVVALASLGDVAKLAEELKLVGRILGRERRAGELAAYFTDALGIVRERLKTTERGVAPRVYMAFWGSLTRTPIHYDPVDIAGGLNLAEKIMPDVLGSVGTMVKVEQIILWDPDVILVHGNYLPKERTVTVEGILKDPKLASLKAVKSNKVFYTFGFWNWWDMAEVLLETEYLAHLFHPARFPDFDLAGRGAAIYKKFYGLDDGFAKLSAVLRCGEWAHE